jgi:hypothetical protein
MFPTSLIVGTPYDVTVGTQPSGPVQSCTVTNGTGVIGSEDVTNIAVSCVQTEFLISGTVTGLTGTGLVLQNNGGDNLAVTADGPFTFAIPVLTGTPYNVTVAVAPTAPAQGCTVINGAGIVNGADVTNVEVSCSELPPI